MGTKSRWDSEKTKPSRFHFTSSNSSSNFSGNESVTVQRRFFVSLMRSTTPCVVIAKAPTERPKIAQGIAAWDLGPPVSNRPGAIHPRPGIAELYQTLQHPSRLETGGPRPETLFITHNVGSANISAPSTLWVMSSAEAPGWPCAVPVGDFGTRTVSRFPRQRLVRSL